MNTNAINTIMLLRLNVLPPFSYDDDEGDRDSSDYAEFFELKQNDCLLATEKYLAAWEEFAAHPSLEAVFDNLVVSRRSFIANFPFVFDELGDSDEIDACMVQLRKVYTQEVTRGVLSECLDRFRNALISLGDEKTGSDPVD